MGGQEHIKAVASQHRQLAKTGSVENKEVVQTLIASAVAVVETQLLGCHEQSKHSM